MVQKEWQQVNLSDEKMFHSLLKNLQEKNPLFAQLVAEKMISKSNKLSHIVSHWLVACRTIFKRFRDTDKHAGEMNERNVQLLACWWDYDLKITESESCFGFNT